jgi:hypothetical protein
MKKILVIYVIIIILITLIILFLAIYESYRLINSKSFYSNGKSINNSFLPIISTSMDNNLPIGDTLFTAYHNLVFDISYIRVIKGNYLFLFKINKKSFL